MGVTKANVIDIRHINTNLIDKKNIFALDTNILYWMHYSRSSLARNVGYQLTTYPNFISDLLMNGNKLVTTIYNITELIYIIERNEFDIYRLANSTISKKGFRDVLPARIGVKNELETVMLQIKEIYEVMEFNIDILGIDDFMSDFSNHNCDDFDYLIIKNLLKNGISSIISDDSDLVTMENLMLFTANENIVNKAMGANLLVTDYI